MIGVENSYVFDCEINGIRDFIVADETFFFRISEFAGGVLPEFEMTFVTSQDRIHKLLHEGVLIKAQLGKSKKEINDISLYCTSWASSQHGANLTAFNLKGFAVNIDYSTSPRLTSYSQMSAVQAVLACARARFGSKVKSNITTSLDSQNWYQPNITDKNFITKTIYRADLSNSFPAIAINIKGEFILKDILKDKADKSFKWSFVNYRRNPNDEKEIVYVGDANAVSNNGIVNKIIGYGFDFISMVIETEQKITELIKRKAGVLSNSASVGGSSTANTKKVIGIQQNENVHTNYQRSYNHNLTSLLNLSSHEIPFSVYGIYHEISVLDKAQFFRGNKMIKKDVDSASFSSSDDYNSGAYYVTAVIRQIENRKFNTTVKLSREMINTDVS